MIRLRTLLLLSLLAFAIPVHGQASGAGQLTCGSASGIAGACPAAVVVKTANYTVVANDFVVNQQFDTNCTSSGYNTAACTYTLPSTAPATGEIYIHNSTPVTVIVNPNGLNIDLFGWNRTIPQGVGILISTDGSNYHTLGVFQDPNTFIIRRYVRGQPNDVLGNPNYTWEFMPTSSSDVNCTTTNELAPTTTAPIATQMTTSATSGNFCAAVYGQGDNASGNTTHPNQEDFQMWVHLPSATVTSQRIWVGFVGSNSVTRATQAGSDTLSNGSAPSGGAAFRLSTSASDTTWQCVTSDGSATNTVTSTSLTLDTNWHLFRVFNDDSVSPVKSYFFVDGALVCGGAISSHTIAAGTQPYVGMLSTTLTTATKEFDIGPASLSTN